VIVEPFQPVVRRRGGLRKGYTNRRDLCYFVGKRALTLTPLQMTYAWDMLARQLHHRLGEMDLPKFVNLISLIRAATIKAKSVTNEHEWHRLRETLPAGATGLE